MRIKSCNWTIDEGNGVLTCQKHGMFQLNGLDTFETVCPKCAAEHDTDIDITYDELDEVVVEDDFGTDNEEVYADLFPSDWGWMVQRMRFVSRY